MKRTMRVKPSGEQMFITVVNWLDGEFHVATKRNS